MSLPFSLRVPLDARYRGLAPDIASKYVELSGGAASDAATLASALASAIGEISREAGADADVDLTFAVANGGLEVTVRCGGRSSVVRQPLATPKP